MAEGWTWAETRRKHRWCDGRGFSNGVPNCAGRAALRTETVGEQLCQRCINRLGMPPSSKKHVTNDHDDCVTWCPACAENAQRGLNPDGTVKQEISNG